MSAAASPPTFLFGAPPPRLRLCIIGAGAVGGLLAAKCAAAGHQVSVLARGATLETLRGRGVKLHQLDGTILGARVRACGSAAEAGPQQVIILAVKAHDIEQAIAGIDEMLEPETMVVPVQNGVPWWYFQRHSGPLANTRLESVDPGGRLTAAIDSERIAGCVPYTASIVNAPAEIRHVEGDYFPVGEPDGSETARVRLLHDLFVDAGFTSRVLTDIRAEIWTKLWGNLCFNPISALTHATLIEICAFPETRALSRRAMEEAAEIASRLGVTLRMSLDARLALTEQVGAHKTSMLQDAEAGRRLEVEALTGAVLELARLTGTPAPAIEALYACTKLLDATLRRHGVAVRALPRT